MITRSMASAIRLREAKLRTDGDAERGDRWVETISSEPRASVYHNFLSRAECEHLIKLARPHMQRSKVVDSTGIKETSARTSSGTCLARGRDKIIRDIEKRIADFTSIPVEHGEPLQVIHYGVGQKYEPHFDYGCECTTKNGGPRMVTVLMYLSDVEEGGETVFPSAKGDISSAEKGLSFFRCTKKGLSVKPKMGDALVFWSMKADGTLDKSSFHGGSPVIKGDKWASTKWLHVNEFKSDKL